MDFEQEVTNWLSDFGFRWSSRFQRGFYKHRWTRPAKWSNHFDEFILTHVLTKAGGEIGVAAILGVDSILLNRIDKAADLSGCVSDDPLRMVEPDNWPTPLFHANLSTVPSNEKPSKTIWIAESRSGKTDEDEFIWKLSTHAFPFFSSLSDIDQLSSFLFEKQSRHPLYKDMEIKSTDLVGHFSTALFLCDHTERAISLLERTLAGAIPDATRREFARDPEFEAIYNCRLKRLRKYFNSHSAHQLIDFRKQSPYRTNCKSS